MRKLGRIELKHSIIINVEQNKALILLLNMEIATETWALITKNCQRELLRTILTVERQQCTNDEQTTDKTKWYPLNFKFNFSYFTPGNVFCILAFQHVGNFRINSFYQKFGKWTVSDWEVKIVEVMNCVDRGIKKHRDL